MTRFLRFWFLCWDLSTRRTTGAGARTTHLEMDDGLDRLIRDHRERGKESLFVGEERREYVHPVAPPGTFLQALERSFTGAKKAAEDAKRFWNQPIRDVLRRTTGLRLVVGDWNAQVPVRVVDNVMPEFLWVIGALNDEAGWDVIFAMDALLDAAKGLKRLASLARKHPGLGFTVGECEAESERIHSLLRASGASALLQRFRSVPRDILGCYWYDPLDPRIDLYWMAIATLAKVLNVSVESLTVVVLAHELAHAYSQLGRDIDKWDWPVFFFHQTSKDVVEGIAQFYTELVVHDLAPRYPDARRAYQRLLKLQSGPYLAHLDWKPNDTHRGEIIRSAMMEFRRSGELTHEEFLRRLDR